MGQQRRRESRTDRTNKVARRDSKSESDKHPANRRIRWLVGALAVTAVAALLSHQTVRRVVTERAQPTLPDIPPPLTAADKKQQYLVRVRDRDSIAQDAVGHPQDSRLWLRLARANSVIGDYQGAIHALNRVLTIDSKSTVALYAIALYHSHLSQFDDGERYATRLISLEPEKIDGWIAAGWVAYRKGKRAAVTANLNRASSIAGLSLDDRIRLASQCVALGDPVAAIKQLRIVIDQQPDHAGAQGLLGAMYLGLSRSKEAIDCLRTAVRLNPHDGRAQHMLARSLMDAPGGNRDKEILSLLQQALENQPHDVEAHMTMASYLQKKKQWREASNHYALALRYDPNRQAARYALFRLGMKLGSQELVSKNRAIYHDLHELALEETRLKSEVDNHPQKPGPLLTLSRFQSRIGEYARALELAQQANAIDPDNHDARSELERLNKELTVQAPNIRVGTFRENGSGDLAAVPVNQFYQIVEKR